MILYSNIVNNFLSVFVSLAGPAGVPYTFLGEIVPQRNRDLTMSLVNALQILGSALVPCKYIYVHITYTYIY